MTIRSFISTTDLSSEEMRGLFDLAARVKAEPQAYGHELAGTSLAMIFQKSSLRTRLGFETAMVQLGGHAANLEDHQVGLAKREDPRDIARVISSMCDGIMARVYAHQFVIELAANSTVPVINGLSDWSHPCQALSDMMTVKDVKGSEIFEKYR